MSKEAGTRFNAYDDLFSIRLAESESLSSLIVRVDEVMHRIKGLRPDDFDITKMDEELAIMAMIRALPQSQYGSFVSSLLLQKGLKKASVQAAFKAEGHRGNPDPAQLSLQTLPSELPSLLDPPPPPSLKSNVTSVRDTTTLSQSAEVSRLTRSSRRSPRVSSPIRSNRSPLLLPKHK